MHRELSKRPECPPLTAAEIADLTALCFEEMVVPVDCLIVLGTSSDHASFAEQLIAYLESSDSEVILTGGSPCYGREPTESDLRNSEAATLLRKLERRKRFSSSVKLIEFASNNTLENVVNVKEAVAARGYTSVGLMAQSHACRRASMTAKRHLGSVDIGAVLPVNTLQNGKVLDADNWHHHPNHREIVWGEVLRMNLYGARCDLELGPWEDMVTSFTEAYVAAPRS